MPDIFGVDFKLLVFGVPVGQFGGAGLVFYPHQLDDHVEGLVCM